MTSELVIRVHGTPAPQGSHRAFVVNGRPVVTQDSKKTKPWREAVKHAALEARGHDWKPAARHTPVAVNIIFWLPRPGGHYGTGRRASILLPSAPAFPAKRPDLDKLARSTLDALTDAGVYHDDNQVVTLLLSKQYAAGLDVPPGAQIRVERLEPEPELPL